jgi:hypothetical protein
LQLELNWFEFKLNIFKFCNSIILNEIQFSLYLFQIQLDVNSIKEKWDANWCKMYWIPTHNYNVEKETLKWRIQKDILFHFIRKSIKLMEPEIALPKTTPMNHHHKNLEGMNKVINISFEWHQIICFFSLSFVHFTLTLQVFSKYHKLGCKLQKKLNRKSNFELHLDRVNILPTWMVYLPKLSTSYLSPQLTYLFTHLPIIPPTYLHKLNWPLVIP